jgi:hypothetical protein
MKKLCLLSGMIILSAVASLTAMEDQNRPAAWRAIDACLEDVEGNTNWEGIFEVLRKNPKLVNQYYTPSATHMSVLEIAMWSGDIKPLERLLREFNADPNAFNTRHGNRILKDAKVLDQRYNPNYGVPGAETLTSLLEKYGARDVKIQGR